MHYQSRRVAGRLARRAFFLSRLLMMFDRVNGELLRQDAANPPGVDYEVRGNSSLNALLKIFPTFVLGRSFRKYTCFGTLYPVSAFLQ